eukprot:s405_g15.t2
MGHTSFTAAARTPKDSKISVVKGPPLYSGPSYFYEKSFRAGSVQTSTCRVRRERCRSRPLNWALASRRTPGRQQNMVWVLRDPLANATGKRVATNSGMKTTFAAESSLNIARRTKMGCVPLGCAVEDDAAITEELSIENLDLSSRSRQLMPRRPAWSYEISSGRLHHREAQSFRKWLDDVQDWVHEEMIQERGGYPPAYETNLQVWRQLWRVLERCHVAVVVLDARHPLLHLPPALVYHVNRTLRKPLVVVMNKLDAVEPENAVSWAKALADFPKIRGTLAKAPSRLYVLKEDLRERAFSGLRIGKAALIEVCHEAYTEHLAKHPAAKAEAEAATVKAEVPDPDPDPTAAEDADFAAASSFNGARAGFFFGTGVQGTGYYRDMQANAKTAAPARARAPAGGYAPAIPAAAGSGAGPEDLAIPEGSIMLGLVGHPNVGKSAMIVSILITAGITIVTNSAGATPGHTKTLQTLKLDDKTCLCDSPGVVFPRLEVPREAQIVGMLMPLAQVREPFSAIRWVMERSMRPLPEHLGLKPVTLKRVWELQDLGLETLRVDLENDTVPWSPMLLCAQMAAQRGFMHSGRPDCVKAGTEILERVLQGRVPYCVPPPSPGGSKAAQAVDDGESSSDYACDDEDYESEQDSPELVGGYQTS